MAKGYVTCILCHPPRDVVPRLMRAHMAIHDGTDYISQRRKVTQPAAGSGSRSRDNTEGRGNVRLLWKREEMQ